LIVRLLVDISAGLSVTEALRRLGHDAADVRERDPRMEDVDILAWAVAEQRLVVTMDKDFGELVYRSGHSHAGVLLLRLDAMRTAGKVQIVEAIFQQFGDQLPGRFAVYQDGRLRIR
jgi:predicted nuclease of predicted toxin-antitoxin system